MTSQRQRQWFATIRAIILALRISFVCQNQQRVGVDCLHQRNRNIIPIWMSEARGCGGTNFRRPAKNYAATLSATSPTILVITSIGTGFDRHLRTPNP